MKVLVTGITGQLGFDVLNELHNKNIEVIGTGRKEFDLTEEESITDFIRAQKPDAIIHCAAYTAVDKAEEQQELAYKINAIGPKNLAIASKLNDNVLIYIV